MLWRSDKGNILIPSGDSNWRLPALPQVHSREVCRPQEAALWFGRRGSNPTPRQQLHLHHVWSLMVYLSGYSQPPSHNEEVRKCSMLTVDWRSAWPRASRPANLTYMQSIASAILARAFQPIGTFTSAVYYWV